MVPLQTRRAATQEWVMEKMLLWVRWRIAYGFNMEDPVLSTSKMLVPPKPSEISQVCCSNVWFKRKHWLSTWWLTIKLFFFFSFFEGVIVDWTNGTSWGMLPSGTLHKPASPEFKWVLKEQSHCYVSVNLITVMSFHFMVRVFEILWYLKKFWVWAISCLFPCFHKFLYDLNSKCLIYSCLPMQKMTQTRTGSRRVWGSREHIVHPSKHRLALEIHSSFSTMMIFYFRSVFLKFCDI